MAFHVPERNRITDGHIGSDSSYANNGAFQMASPEPGWTLFIVASDGEGWEHVSVHAIRRRRDGLKADQSRTPLWSEMTFVKDLFWDAEDVVMQLHPRKSEYVNQHPHTLHLWRPENVTIPTPATNLVGVR